MFPNIAHSMQCLTSTRCGVSYDKHKTMITDSFISDVLQSMKFMYHLQNSFSITFFQSHQQVSDTYHPEKLLFFNCLFNQLFM